MQLLLEQCDYTVVAAIGSEGSGKSALLSLFANPACNPFLAAAPAAEALAAAAAGAASGTAHGGGGGGGSGASAVLQACAFPAQTAEHLLACAHRTEGVDALVTPERVIVLDTQPLHSASVLHAMIRDDVPLPPATSVHALMAWHSAQLAAWAIAVSHVVLVVADSLAEEQLWRTVAACDMLRRAVQLPPLLGRFPEDKDATRTRAAERKHPQPDAQEEGEAAVAAGPFPRVAAGHGAVAGGAGAPASWRWPDVVFVLNKCAPHVLSLDGMLRVRHFLSRRFVDVPFRKHGWPSCCMSAVLPPCCTERALRARCSCVQAAVVATLSMSHCVREEPRREP